jgi:hypothetical protein
MKEETSNAYADIAVDEMDKYLSDIFKTKSIETLNIVITNLNEEINEKYPQKNWMEKYISVILPIIIPFVAIYLTNNNIKKMTEILYSTGVTIMMTIITFYFIWKIKNISITPVDKRKNLLYLKSVLINIKMKWILLDNK